MFLLKGNHTDYKKFSDINKAFWGKDYANNKQYDASQIQSLSSSSGSLVSNTYLPKVANLVKSADLTESAFRRLNYKEMQFMYENYDTFRKQFEKMDGYTELVDAMGRDGFPIKISSMFKKIFELRLWEQ